MKNISLLIIISITLLFCFACNKTETSEITTPLPPNPYDSIVQPNDSIIETPVDSASFLGIHRYILAKSCAQIGCHDGNFEPNFKTVESAYATLVLHPTIKNNANFDFKYRVVPGDTAYSWLHERITTDDPLLGRMPLYDSLSKQKIALISKWIMNGAKDPFGNSPSVADYQPALFGIYADLPDNGFTRVDNIRTSLYQEPFKVPQNTNLRIWFGIYDKDIEGNPIPAYNLSYNKVKFSQKSYDFKNLVEKTLTKDATPTIFPSFYGQMLPYFHHITVNTADFPVGKIIYMRVYVKDANHATPTELPSQSAPYYLMLPLSFIVQ
jgi:hypothetical protein